MTAQTKSFSNVDIQHGLVGGRSHLTNSNELFEDVMKNIDEGSTINMNFSKTLNKACQYSDTEDKSTWDPQRLGWKVEKCYFASCDLGSSNSSLLLAALFCVGKLLGTGWPSFN